MLDPTETPATKPNAASLIHLVESMLGELREQRATNDRLHAEAEQGRKSARRWKRSMQLLVFGSPFLPGLLYFLLFLVNTGSVQLNPWRDAVGVVRIEGAITPNKPAFAERVVAGRYSLVGSIGALMEGWQVDRALNRLEVSQRLYVSGKLKAFLNPFGPLSPEADAKANSMVKQIAGTFLDEVKRKRGAGLDPATDYATGEVWVGDEAQRLGLVDSIGTIDGTIDETWGLKAKDFGPRQLGTGLLGGIGASLERIADAVSMNEQVSIR